MRPAALIVSTFDPTDGGGAPVVTRGRIDSLHRLGYEVVLVRDADGPFAGPPSASLSRVVDRASSGSPKAGRNLLRTFASGTLPRWNAGTWQALKAEVTAHPPALVVLDGARTAEYGVLLRETGYAGPILLHEHNVEHLLLERQRSHEPRWNRRLELAVRVWRLREVESRLVQYADAALALSEVDRGELERLNPGFPVTVAPPVIDLKRYQPSGESGASPELLFIGSCRWAPNLDGLEWFVREIWNQVRAAVPDARLNVVGRGAPEWLSSVPGVTVAGYVEDERPSYASARAVIVPLRFGSGVRIKILNAFAMSRAVISTSLGAEGIPAVSGESIALADTAETFAARTVELLRDRSRASAMGEAGLSLARSHYSPEAVDRSLREAITAASRRSHSSP
jgi:glycosyltransferase involved in cell wall biosynthesis